MRAFRYILSKDIRYILHPTNVKNVSCIIRRNKNKINNPIKIWWPIINENRLHVIKIAKGIIKDRNIKDTFLYIHNLVQLFSEIRSENTQKKFISLMTYDITSMYSKYVLGKFQIYNLIRSIILYNKIMSLNNKLLLFFFFVSVSYRWRHSDRQWQGLGWWWW